MEINNSDCRAFFIETINMMYMYDGKTNILGDEVEKKQKINDLKNYFIIVIKLNKNKRFFFVEIIYKLRHFDKKL